MKKVLSIVLALILLLSVTPVVSAADVSQREAYIAEAKKSFVYTSSAYGSVDVFNEIFEAYSKVVSEEDFDITKEWIDENEERLPVVTAKLKAVSSDIEAKIASKEITVVIDATDFLENYCNAFAYYDFEDVENLVENADEKLLDKARDSYDAAFEIIEKGNTEPESVSQAQFDEIAVDFIAFYKAIEYCLAEKHNCTVWTAAENGKHSSVCDFCGDLCVEEHLYGEYVSNNDATEEADGTKTAVCEKCGEESTVTDEGSQLVKEPATFIEKLIEFIKNLFAKIFAIFG